MEPIRQEPLFAPALAKPAAGRVIGLDLEPPDDKDLRARLDALLAVRDYPARIPCVHLPWRTLLDALQGGTTFL
ncbi:MAG: hypothetical protein FJ387_30995 [Verrucomicrobia bacterium]|nr:hypothetical protein [Verrucomicrobiota bacterium]